MKEREEPSSLFSMSMRTADINSVLSVSHSVLCGGEELFRVSAEAERAGQQSSPWRQQTPGGAPRHCCHSSFQGP